MTERLNLTEPQCSLELFTIARTWKLTPWKESYDQPRQHIEKQRHYFSDKGLSSQTDLAMVFPVVTHGCEVWTIKKAEHRRIDAIELPCLEGF